MINFTSMLQINRSNGYKTIINPNSVVKIDSYTDNSNCKVFYSNDQSDTFEISAEKLSKKLQEANYSQVEVTTMEKDPLDETPFLNTL